MAELTTKNKPIVKSILQLFEEHRLTVQDALDVMQLVEDAIFLYSEVRSKPKGKSA